MPLSSSHWSTLISAIRSGAVCRLSFYGVNLSALDHEAFLVAIGCRGLQSLSVESSVVPRGFVADDLIRTNAAKDLLQLSYADNKGDAPHRCSDDDVLDFYFPTDAAPEVQSRHLSLEGFKVTDMFLTKCFERLRSSPARPSGSLKFYGTAKQRGLSTYAQYLTPGDPRQVHVAYRFPPLDEINKPYEVELYECSKYT